MNYDPLDPKNYAFYATFIADERNDEQRPRGCSGCLTVIVIAVALTIVTAMLR